MDLNSDKTSKVFCINICCFLTRFHFLVPRWHRLTHVSSKMCMCSISTPRKTRMFTVRLIGNGQYTKETVLRCHLTTQISLQLYMRDCAFDMGWQTIRTIPFICGI